VRDVIERDGVVRHGLSRGLINAHALARSIQLANPRGVSFDAILSAIRRYGTNGVSENQNTSPKMIHKLTMKNQVTVLSIRNQPEVQLIVAQFAEEVDYTHGETFRVVIGPKSVSVTADSKNASKLASRIPKARLVKQIENLAELDVDMAPHADSTAGMISAVTTELAINDINIIQLSTVGPGHLLILVDERKATNAYQVLDSMCKPK
jgi:hypothetical protein